MSPAGNLIVVDHDGERILQEQALRETVKIKNPEARQKQIWHLKLNDLIVYWPPRTTGNTTIPGLFQTGKGSGIVLFLRASMLASFEKLESRLKSGQ